MTTAFLLLLKTLKRFVILPTLEKRVSNMTVSVEKESRADEEVVTSSSIGSQA
jgi:hypothetical protein